MQYNSVVSVGNIKTIHHAQQKLHTAASSMLKFKQEKYEL